METMNFL